VVAQKFQRRAQYELETFFNTKIIFYTDLKSCFIKVSEKGQIFKTIKDSIKIVWNVVEF